MRTLLVHRARRLAKRLLPPRPAILMYHRIAAEAVDPWGLAVTPQRFDAQLHWLECHRVVLPLAEFTGLHNAGTLPRRAIAITFDDGYACNATEAVPRLAAHGMPATIFLATTPIERRVEFWWDDLQRMVFDSPVEQLRISLGGRDVQIDIGPRSAGPMQWPPGRPAAGPRQEGFMALWQELRVLDPARQDAALDDIRAQTGTPMTPRASHRPMTPSEIRDVAAGGLVEFGGHTLTHPALSQWSADVQHAEIEGGRDACLALTARAPRLFAYPYGDFDGVSVDASRAAGFEAACTTVTAAVQRDSDPLMLPRLGVGDWPPERLASALRAL